MFGLFLRMGGWLVVLPLFVIVAAVMSSGESGENAARLQAEGQTAEATITGKYQERRWRGSRSRAAGPDHVVQFRYSSGSVLRGDFKVGLGEARVSEAFYTSVAEGDTRPLRYLPGDDSVFELEPGSVSGEATNTLLVAALVGGVCLPLFLLIGWNAARAARLRTAGAATEGRVERIEVRAIVEVLEFSFTDAGGTPRRGRTLPRRPNGFGALQPGDALRIVYDAARPERAFWVGDLGESTAGR